MDYNNLFTYDNGDLYWISSNARNVKLNNNKAGSLRRDGYIGIFINSKYHFAHRIIWEMHNGRIPKGLVIDHINGIRSDNRLENLRLCTESQNCFNRPKQSNNKSGFKGVSWHKQKTKWVAQIKIDKRNKFLGFFSNPLEAYKKYCEVAKLHYGEFARLD
jgi:hypothetical protein